MQVSSSTRRPLLAHLVAALSSVIFAGVAPADASGSAPAIAAGVEPGQGARGEGTHEQAVPSAATHRATLHSATIRGATMQRPSPRGAAVQEHEALKSSKKAEAHGGVPIHFAGFHVFEDGTSRIWVKLPAEVSVDVVKGKAQVTFILRNAYVPLKNNQNPLLTSHFPSAVVSARLTPVKQDTELVIQLREDVEVKQRVVKRPDGGVSIQFDVPARVASR